MSLYPAESAMGFKLFQLTEQQKLNTLESTVKEHHNAEGERVIEETFSNGAKLTCVLDDQTDMDYRATYTQADGDQLHLYGELFDDQIKTTLSLNDGSLDYSRSPAYSDELMIDQLGQMDIKTYDD